MEKFDSLIRKASQFVEKQKGVWDHSKWQAFMSDTQKKGVTLNEEMQHYLGAVTESMKKFYHQTTDTGKKMMGTVSEQVAKFVDKTRGKWEHLDWEKFVKDIQRKGADITENNRENLGGILESAKRFYHALPKTILGKEGEAKTLKEQEAIETASKQKSGAVRKQAEAPAGKATRAKKPKKEGTTTKPTSTKKAQPEKGKKTRTASTASQKGKASEKVAQKRSAAKKKTGVTTAKPASSKKTTTSTTRAKRTAR